jgi:hypothetical protein
MKQNQFAKIVILLAIICLLLEMSGWVSQRLGDLLLVSALCLLLLSLFLLRKKKRKSKRVAKKPAKEAAGLLERETQEKGM